MKALGSSLRWNDSIGVLDTCKDDSRTFMRLLRRAKALLATTVWTVGGMFGLPGQVSPYGKQWTSVRCHPREGGDPD